MSLTITSGNGSIILTYLGRKVSIKVNQIKDIILTGSVVSIIHDYVYDPETYSTNRIDIDYTEVTSPTYASGEELFQYLNSSYATEISSVSSGETGNTTGSTLAKWETVGDVTYLFYQSRISTAADLEAGIIKKIDSSTGSITWAEGSDNTFNKTWALRATYSYSPLTS